MTDGRAAVPVGLTNLPLPREPEPVVKRLLNRHLSMFKESHRHDYVPWSDGRNYYALGGQDWEPGQSQLSELAQVAMVQNLLTEDACRPITARSR